MIDNIINIVYSKREMGRTYFYVLYWNALYNFYFFCSFVFCSLSLICISRLRAVQFIRTPSLRVVLFISLRKRSNLFSRLRSVIRQSMDLQTTGVDMDKLLLQYLIFSLRIIIFKSMVYDYVNDARTIFIIFNNTKNSAAEYGT